jgi:NADH pyrophosphatase NudC (nudix superfamily)
VYDAKYSISPAGQEIGAERNMAICPRCGSRNTEYNNDDDGSNCKDCKAVWHYESDE